MALWISSVVLSALAVITLGFPQPDDSAYNIPSVGTGQRSQYYVGHADGTFKYGYDTGDGAFESAKLKGDGQLDGQFGYTDPEGNDVRLEYESGTSGFVASGSHLPQPPAEVAQAIAAARTRTSPFVDPLASRDADASFGFGFKDEVYSRNEEADEDGTVRGSYTYTDEDGVTRTYNYRAGSGIGFEIEGNDFSQSGNGESPASTRLTGSASRTRLTSTGSSGSSGIRSSASSSGTRTSTGFSGTRSSTSSGYSGTRTSGTRATSSNNYSGSKKRPSAFNSITVNKPSTIKHSSTSLHQSSRPVGTSVRQPTASRPSSFTSQTVGQTHYRPSSTSSSSVTRTSSNRNKPFEVANVRSTQSTDGSYNLSYQTSSHSRSESGDSNNNVKGDFAFVADDQQNRQIKYEAGSNTGFIAEGAHIPVGPEVPGAPSGQPTGAFARTQPKDFVDPLSDTASDSSYGFGFQDGTYSRTEKANEDGTVSGSYTYTDEDGITRTYRYRAGKGIGFVIEGTDFARSDDGESPASTTLTGVSSSSSLSSTRLTGSSNQQRVSTGSRFSTTTSFGLPSHSSSAGSNIASSNSLSRGYSGSSIRNTGSSLRPSTSFRPAATSAITSIRGSSHTNPRKSTFTPSSKTEVSPEFTLHQYDQSNSPDKFGYVLKFDQ